MSRSRVVGGLLALILVVCGAVIYLDQNGAFGDTSTPVVNPVDTSTTAPTPLPDTSTSDGYGELK